MTDARKPEERRGRGGDAAPTPAARGKPADRTDDTPTRAAAATAPTAQLTVRALFTVGPTTASWTGAPPGRGEQREPDLYLTELEPVPDPDTAEGDAVVFPVALRVRRAIAGGPFVEGRRVALLLTYEVE